jgi:hypothetical protein
MRCSAPTATTLPQLLARRDWMTRMGGGLAGAALASLLAEDAARANPVDDFHNIPGPHFAPKAKSVIQLFQHGGPSHMDLFDPKPELNQRDGQPMPSWFTDLVAISAHGNLMGVPFKFAKHGDCGVEYSEIIPHVASCADDIALIRSMYTEHNNHEQALWMIHGGTITTGRPTIGCWVNYALGSENKDLPAYVVLRNDNSYPVDRSRNWSAGWLPPKYQGVHLRNEGTPVLYLQPDQSLTPKVDGLRRELLAKLNNQHRANHAAIDGALEARIASYEMAARMQLTAADALDINQESAETHKLYGLDNPVTAPYARRCLMARRLVERGVRYVQIFVEGQRWDTHGDNANATKKICDETDQPSAALLKDLKRRGMLNDTLLIWGGEFGRTPVSQSGNGRDHHKQGFSMWMAGGGIKGGQAYGATDSLGYNAVENRTKVADFHATVFHLLGLDHNHVSYRMRGRDEKLTDVHHDAKVLNALIA